MKRRNKYKEGETSVGLRYKAGTVYPSTSDFFALLSSRNATKTTPDPLFPPRQSILIPFFDPFPTS